MVVNIIQKSLSKRGSILKYRYTEKQLKDLLDGVVVLVDTRDKKNEHIISYFEKHKINYQTKALSTGDYSYMIRANPELGISFDIYFSDELIIERKNSLSELAGNFVEKDGRFLREVGRMSNINHKYLLIENDSLHDLFAHNYRSEFNETSFLRSILTIGKTYGIHIFFCSVDDIGEMIYEICRSNLLSHIITK